MTAVTRAIRAGSRAKTPGASTRLSRPRGAGGPTNGCSRVAPPLGMRPVRGTWPAEVRSP